MYCNKCGKQIESGTLCQECYLAEQQAQAQAYAEQQAKIAYEQAQKEYTYTMQNGDVVYENNFENPMPDPQNRMFGFGKALTSTILGWVGFIFAYIGLIGGIIDPDVGILFFMMSLPLVIIPLVFGIASIKVFMKRKATCVKPIATLILGIDGLAASLFSAFFSFVTLLVIALGA
ncbi:MAG: hypothetical protein J6R40_02190 [Clostridia bacterium]|nr:hypothetical protein [Clostridia bacterium]